MQLASKSFSLKFIIFVLRREKQRSTPPSPADGSPPPPRPRCSRRLLQAPLGAQTACEVVVNLQPYFGNCATTFHFVSHSPSTPLISVVTITIFTMLNITTTNNDNNNRWPGQGVVGKPSQTREAVKLISVCGKSWQEVFVKDLSYSKPVAFSKHFPRWEEQYSHFHLHKGRRKVR